MRISGIVVGSLAAVLLALVATCAPAPTTPVGVSPSNAGGGPPSVLALGDYSCRITEQGYDYPPFRCIVRTDGNRTLVEKIEGSVRFRGIAVAARGGFELHGEVFCPWGDCTEPVRAVFHPVGGGSYVGEFPDRRQGPAMVVTLQPAGYGGYGGGSYGGAGYGYGYGGGGYGGYRYGGGY